jgi:hypothetical protein
MHDQVSPGIMNNVNSAADIEAMRMDVGLMHMLCNRFPVTYDAKESAAVTL